MLISLSSCMIVVLQLYDCGLAVKLSGYSINDSAATSVQSSTIDGRPGYIDSGGKVIAEPHSQIRRKRTIYSMVKAAGAVLKGMQAERKLLAGATLKSPREYIKPGGLAQAKRDFRQNVDPRTAMKFDYPGGGQGIWGEAGDRTIVMESRGIPGTTTIEIIKNLEHADETIDIIRYIE